MLEIKQEFSADELMHMALYAFEQGRHDQALMYLRTHALKEPNNALVQLALGGQYAKLHHYEKALSALQQAAALDETLHIVHLHSAFILLASNQFVKAEAALQPLLLLADNHYLCSFAKGLIAYCQADKTQAVYFLELGISQNQQDPFLNNNITNLLVTIKVSDNAILTEPREDTTKIADISLPSHNLLSSTCKKSGQ